MTAVARTVAGLFAAAIAFLYLGRTFTPDSSIYLLVNDHVLRWLSTLIEVPTLVAGSLFSFGAARALGRENPAARGFRLLGMWMAFLAVGQLAYSFHPLILRCPTPLPWWGDALYLAGYSAMIAGIVSFQRTYASSGFAVGTPPHRSVLGVAIAVAAAEVLLLAPIFDLETP